MSAEKSESVAYPPTDGVITDPGASDVEMVAVLDPNSSKCIRNVQTQHGDYRSVDAENIFLIPRCLWPEDDKQPSAMAATTSSDSSENKAAQEDAEQVVWIEPFADEVCYKYLFPSCNILGH